MEPAALRLPVQSCFYIVPAVPVRVIFDCAVYRIAEFLKKVHIPVTGIGHHNTSAAFLRFPPDFRKEAETHALIATRLIHPQQFNKRDVPEVHARKASGRRFAVIALDLSSDPFKVMRSRHL